MVQQYVTQERMLNLDLLLVINVVLVHIQDGMDGATVLDVALGPIQELGGGPAQTVVLGRIQALGQVPAQAVVLQHIQ